MTENLFISWSGDMSRAIAEALRGWLPSVIQAVRPWLSATDMEKGVRWAGELSDKLEETSFGIICLTPNNLRAPWLLFEAGALSKKVENARVCPYLVGVEGKDIEGPLTQFQFTKAEKDDTADLLRTINGILGDFALSEKQLEKSFEVWWPKLEEQLHDILKGGGEQAAPPKRSQEEILEEILSIVRSQTRYLEEQQRQAKWNDVLNLFEGSRSSHFPNRLSTLRERSGLEVSQSTVDELLRRNRTFSDVAKRIIEKQEEGKAVKAAEPGKKEDQES